MDSFIDAADYPTLFVKSSVTQGKRHEVQLHLCSSEYFILLRFTKDVGIIFFLFTTSKQYCCGLHVSYKLHLISVFCFVKAEKYELPEKEVDEASIAVSWTIYRLHFVFCYITNLLSVDHAYELWIRACAKRIESKFQT